MPVTTYVKMCLIVAMAEDRVIGKNNSLPWSVPADLRNFRTLTWGKPIIMGRKTFESLGKPLPGRLNIVVSRDPTFRPGDAKLADNFDLALRIATAELERSSGDAEEREIMVIGGEQIFSLALEEADRIYLTEIKTRVAGGDAFFPAIHPTDWQISSECQLCSAEGDMPAANFKVLERQAA